MKAPLNPHLVRWFPNQEWNSPGLGTCCVWDAGPCAALPAGATPEGVPSTWGATVDVPKRRLVIAQNSNSDIGKKMALLPHEWSLDVFIWFYMCLLVFHFYGNDIMMMKYEIFGLFRKVKGMCSESGQMFSDLKTNLINDDTKTDWLINQCKGPKFPGYTVGLEVKVEWRKWAPQLLKASHVAAWLEKLQVVVAGLAGGADHDVRREKSCTNQEKTLRNYMFFSHR